MESATDWSWIEAGMSWGGVNSRCTSDLHFSRRKIQDFQRRGGMKDSAGDILRGVDFMWLFDTNNTHSNEKMTSLQIVVGKWRHGKNTSSKCKFPRIKHTFSQTIKAWCIIYSSFPIVTHLQSVDNMIFGIRSDICHQDVVRLIHTFTYSWKKSIPTS